LAWPGNENGADVQDALGNHYQFVASTGCVDVPVSASQRVTSFCLKPNAATPSGYESWGATGCTGYFGTDRVHCDAGSFGVYLTHVPGNPSACMAVFGTTLEPSVSGTALDLNYDGNAPVPVQGETTTTVFSYTAYWDGTIPICGGTNPYAGTYTGDAAYAASVENGACVASAGGAAHEALQFQIDSGGLIDDDGLEVSGSIDSTGAGSFTQQALGLSQCNGAFTITSASQNSAGKWVLSGTNFQVTQQ